MPAVKSSSLRKHPSKLAAFSACSRKSPQEQGNSKQSKLPDNQAKLAVGGAIRVSQGTVDRFLIRLICEGHQPFSLVEQPAFREFAAALNPQYKMLSRPTVKRRIAEAAAEMKTKLISHLGNINHVATTTDCWSAHQKSYIGVTCHWIDGETFERGSVVLACKRLKGSHTFDVLAGVLDDIHCQYKIRGKVVRTTTDSGSNFVKAFSVFGEQSQSEDDDAGSDTDQEGSESDDDVEFQDAFSILEQDKGLEYQLPKHQRCACHLLNLVATTDADLADKKNDTYKRLSRAAFGKRQALWNKSGRSHTAAEAVEDKCGLQLIRPNKTRWNSTYMAVERIIRIIKEQGEDAIRCVCEELKVKMFSQAEIAFLDEFCCVMRPVVKALNILQSESNTHLGWLLPVISELQSKLRRHEASVKMCLPLISALQQGVQRRFRVMMEDRELISAAILLPKFKTGWTDKAEVAEAGLLYLRHHLDQMAEAEVKQGTLKEHQTKRTTSPR
ncbi:uncharacterized protein LOC133448250 isoform X2 [Cololabis saira]|uniref:uncharacterized protein LOC133448250 isoform X2 n=1 Tax=Cololabis saira TaxID=129043 RepID=UPI002AD28BD7|nr:uncharacterized protein LOC133448250 isoform X2 [Cololabis saira]XP_061582588.1 uncharacterized protein LOC133448250 isoform X2 [Cololabis saira]XP_061582589.1 uncharacterized protein LOC133448250 isoform X2 [Cololabis saira]XP_061582590.1 uncharacterized protein LOC133448250 isoform X2 [Cololabis saira]XP_061582591.1 uncharacterized protein LOC133448250 isoform X2 [Cololabis saira]